MTVLAEQTIQTLVLVVNDSTVNLCGKIRAPDVLLSRLSQFYELNNLKNRIQRLESVYHDEHYQA